MNDWKNYVEEVEEKNGDEEWIWNIKIKKKEMHT